MRFLSPFLQRIYRTHRPWSPYLTILSWLPVVIVIPAHVGQVMWVNGKSMYPYLNTDYDRSTVQDCVLVNTWMPSRGLRRGMCVTFRSPSDPSRSVIKRIVALPGDVVHPIPPGSTSSTHSSKSMSSSTSEDAGVTIPYGYIWVEGEPGNRSIDSNVYGPISANMVLGKAIALVWPWNRRGWLSWRDWKEDVGGRVEVGAAKEKVVRPVSFT